MKTKKRWIAVALGLATWLAGPFGHAETRGLAPDPNKIIAQSWVGFAQTPPYLFYRLVLEKDGTGRFQVLEGDPKQWEISHWSLSPGQYYDVIQVYFTLVPAKGTTQTPLIHAALDRWGQPTLALRIRPEDRIEIPDQAILLLPEARLKTSLAALSALAK